MSSDEDLLADVTINAVVKQRRLAAAAPASLFDSAMRGAQYLTICWQFWAVQVGTHHLRCHCRCRLAQICWGLINWGWR